MNLIRRSTWTIMVLGAAAGCAGEDATPPAAGPEHSPAVSSPAAPAAATAPKAGEMKHADEAPPVEGPKTDAGAAKLTAEELTAIKELPEAEQAVATKQVVCPVSAHHLGSMGKPVTVTAEGRTFYLCCEDCGDMVKTNPKAVIAKLDKSDGK